MDITFGWASPAQLIISVGDANILVENGYSVREFTTSKNGYGYAESVTIDHAQLLEIVKELGNE